MIPYFRLSGAGNDFLALAEPGKDPTAEEIRAWCRRGLSAGADGLFTLRRQGERVAMEYFNADGLGAGLCINGTRCAARLAFHLGWARDVVVILTGAGPVSARLAGATVVTLELPGPEDPLRETTVKLGDHLWEGFFVRVGVPHFILPFREDLARAPMVEVAPRLRHHPVFGLAGANVSFVRFVPPRHLEIRSFERGVEAETLACGTGVLAAVSVGLLIRQLELPATALVRGGFELTVAGRGGEPRHPERWLLTGDARIIARGELSTEASSLPPAPAW